MFKKLSFLFFIFLAALLPFSYSLSRISAINQSRADTIIDNNIIAGNTVWAKDKSPYYVIYDSVVINSGAKLIIEPGVIVKFGGNVGIDVRGELDANGTADQPVVFTSYNDDAQGGQAAGSNSKPLAGDWKNIFVSSGILNLENTIIKYGGRSEVYQTNNSFFKINVAKASFYSDLGAISSYNSLVDINSATITKNIIGVQIGGDVGAAKIHNSAFVDNQTYAMMNNGDISVEATDNWWGNNSGPNDPDSNSSGRGGKITGNILFDPWIGKGLTSERNPVIIVPGIGASYLNENTQGLPEVWPNVPKMMLPGEDPYLYKLLMDDQGEPISSSLIRPTNIFRSLYGKNIFAGLIDELENTGYEENKDLFVFPYDWRWDIDKIAGNDQYELIQSLKEKIEEIKSETGADKVDIIAHSMGGLVVKKYIMDYGKDSIGKFIDIATPHLGAPDGLKALTYGDNLGFSILNKTILNEGTIKKIAQNFPSIYQLLPSRDYFDNNNPDYNSYIGDVYDLDRNGIKGNLNYDQSIEFMKNTGRNAYLLGKNNELHSEIDNFNPNDYGVKAYNIVGCNQPTIGKIYILNKEKTGYEYGIKYINGDGTVPLKSAEHLLNTAQTYYATGTTHPYLSSFNGVKQMVTAILDNQENDFDFSQYSNIKKDKSKCSLNGWQISFHSPIDLQVYDENNNHVGPNSSGDIEMGIEGASYDIIDGNKFAFLPLGHNYRIVGQATDAGKFNARLQTIRNDEIVATAYFNDIPLASTTNIEIPLADGQSGVNMEIDQNGDHIFEKELKPSSMLSGNDLSDLAKPNTELAITGTLGQNNWYVSDVSVELSATDNQNGSGVLKTEFSLDDGAIWQEYTQPIIFKSSGRYKLKYRSTDRAGNIEEDKEKIIQVDQEGPKVDFIIPQDDQEFLHSDNIDLMFNLLDDLSGAVENNTKIFIDQKEISTTALDLYKYEIGEHNLAVVVTDLAGNVATSTVKFQIIADIESTIDDVKRAYIEKLVSNRKAKDDLVDELRQIQNYMERYGYKETRLQKRYAEALVKCQKRKNKSFCERIVKEKYEITTYHLNKDYQRSIKAKLKDLLNDLSKYYKQKWITLNGYDIIKDDINYLLINLKNL